MAKKINQETGIMLPITYISIFVVTATLVYAASMLFPSEVVLGTHAITSGWALIHSIGSLALLHTFVVPVIREYENSRGKMFTNSEWMLTYFVLNFVGLWVLSRFAEQLGLGLRSWLVALVLAVVVNAGQAVVMMLIGKYLPKK